MPKFNPIEVYKEQDVYVIAGGPSVREHNLEVLKNKPVIGLNQSFATPLSSIIDYCVFGDTAFLTWILQHQEERKIYKGIFLTNAPLDRCGECSWLYHMGRVPFMEKGKNLSWYGNTGILGIEVAITLGAKRIFLLGFDNSNAKNTSHHHNYHIKLTKIEIYNLHFKQFERANNIWKEDYPEVEIINLNPNSRLNMFKKISGKRHLKGLTK